LIGLSARRIPPGSEICALKERFRQGIFPSFKGLHAEGQFRPERRVPGPRFSSGANGTGAAMKWIHTIALTAVSTAFVSLSCGVAVAQTVSGNNAYEQGYAAGASAKERNTFNAFDNGYKAGRAAQSDVQSPSALTEGYDRGYQAGIAQANRDQQQAYNEGYEDRRQEDLRMAGRAFDAGFDAGASRRTHNGLEFP
jgi:hypothetical protein